MKKENLMKSRILNLENNTTEVLIGFGPNIFRIKESHLISRYSKVNGIININHEGREIAKVYSLYSIENWKDIKLIDLGITSLNKIVDTTYFFIGSYNKLNLIDLINKEYSQEFPMTIHDAIEKARKYLEPIYELMIEPD